MVVTAHPDDEASSFGGSLRLYAEKGVETCVLCLTAGQASSHRGNARSDHELAAMRRKEFAAACEILKVSRGIVLDYPDGKLHRQDFYRVVSDLTLHIREFRPHVLLTFGPDGSITGHTDHSMASVFATMACQWAGRANRFPDQLSECMKPHRTQKLYYSTANFAMPGREPVTLSPITAVIDISQFFETKMDAFRAHTSQAPLFKLFEENVGRRGPIEPFHLASSVKYAPMEQETDLLTGVSDQA